VDDQSSKPSLLARHGITRAVIIRLLVAVSLVMIVGIRFQRTIVALVVSVVFLGVFLLLGRQAD
jgi:hypothetical protein